MFDPGQTLNINNLVTIAIAVYAAVVSTIALYLIYRQNQINLKVHVALPEQEAAENRLIILSAVNHSRRPITLTAFGLQLPDNRKIVIYGRDSKATRPPLPVRLRQGEVCEAWFDVIMYHAHLQPYGDELVVQAFFRDADRHDHFSQPFTLRLPQLPDNVVLLRRGELSKGKPEKHQGK